MDRAVAEATMVATELDEDENEDELGSVRENWWCSALCP